MFMHVNMTFHVGVLRHYVVVVSGDERATDDHYGADQPAADPGYRASRAVLGAWRQIRQQCRRCRHC